MPLSSVAAALMLECHGESLPWRECVSAYVSRLKRERVFPFMLKETVYVATLLFSWDGWR